LANKYLSGENNFYDIQNFGGIFLSYRLQLLLRSFIICLIAVFIAAIPQDLSAREREVRYLPLNVTIDIFSTGHIHGHIIDWDYAIPQTSEIGLAKVNTIVKNGRLNNKYNLLLDAGSFQYGSAMTAHYADTGFNGIHPMIRASNYMFYDGLILGETDFSQGTKALADAISKSNAPILAANVYDSKTGKLWNRVEPYIIKTFEIGEKAKAKIKIGIIGVTDKASLPEGENFSELNITDQVEAVKK
jgi:2',3'-cyclic-nucleotide 2'-phosphodiesterase (5'-nucleotidase family)